MIPKLIHVFLITLFNFHYLSLQVEVAAAKCHPDDEAGLLAFKSGIISDPSGMLLSWIPGTDCCSTWLGISCSQQNRVTNLELSGQPYNSTQILSGTISPALSKLQYLYSISLTDLRNLSGPFPSFLFNLPRLLYVEIDNNNLSGILPKDIGKLLCSSGDGSLSVEGNMFSGTIPSSLGQLTRLVDLKLGGNMFTGNIPYTIGNLTNLQILRLDRNQLTGTIPDIFKGLTRLEVFNVSHNKLSGNNPGSITATSLWNLEAGHNALTGKIPEFLGILNRLNTLDLSWNQFQGTVPKSFASLTDIVNLDLSHNSLLDPIPEMNMWGIISLDLSYNQFHFGKNIPAWLTSSNVKSLKLAKCGIKINLDNWKPAAPSLYEYINLSENEITGSPFQILNQTGYFLETFYASGNKLKFNLESMQFAPALKYLDLSRNLVFGKVPKAVSGLDMLNVSNNHLCGQLPKTKFPASAFVGNDCLCGSPLPLCKA